MSSAKSVKSERSASSSNSDTSSPSTSLRGQVNKEESAFRSNLVQSQKSSHAAPQTTEKIKIRGVLPSHMPPIPRGLGFSGWLYFLAQGLAIVILALLACWLIEHFGGFTGSTLEDFSRIINYHPMIMFFGFIFLLANSLLFLTSVEALNGARLLMWSLTIIIAVLGLIIGLYWHTRLGFSHFQSLHSWLGVMTMVSLFFYLMFGHRVYFGMATAERVYMLYYLRLIGYGTLVLAGTTAIIGINQLLFMEVVRVQHVKQEDTVENENATMTYEYEHSLVMMNPMDSMNTWRDRNGLVSNTIGLFLVCYILAMIYMSTRMNYKPRTTLRREQVEQILRQQIHKAMDNLEQKGVFRKDDEIDTEGKIVKALTNAMENTAGRINTTLARKHHSQQTSIKTETGTTHKTPSMTTTK